MRRLNAWLEEAYDTKVDATGLAIFRIAYGSILFCELVQLFYFRHLIFDPVPYQIPAKLDPTFPLLVWMTSVIGIILGAWTRVCAFINYILSVIFFYLIPEFQYHAFNIYLGANFLLIFLPVSVLLSVDWRIKRANAAEPQKVTVLCYLIPAFFLLPLVYFDSALYKWASPMWRGGLGFWLPTSMPFASSVDLSFLLNRPLLAKGLGYLVLTFESVFLFLFWFRGTRIPLSLLGACFHLGILIGLAVPLFALCACSLYILLIPPSFWLRLRIGSNCENRNFSSEGQSERSLLDDDSRQIRLRVLKLILSLFIIFQLLSSYQAPLTRAIVATLNVEGTRVDHIMRALSYRSLPLTRMLWGIAPHDIFLDEHFRDYNHIFKITHEFPDGRTVNLPIIDDQGRPDWYNYGANWAYWTHRVNGATVNRERLRKGLERMTAFWAHKNAVSLQQASFKVWVKTIDSASEWEYNFRERQISRSWEEIGSVHWEFSHVRTDLRRVQSQ